jgi:hypothetical protein
MSGEMVCVYRATTVGEADIVAAWLGEHGIPAFVKNRYSVETLHVPQVVAPRGIEVCVADDETAKEAKALLADQAQELARQSREARSSGPVDVLCEECGRTAVFPPTQRGTVQKCPHCRRHVDVP